MKKTAKLILSAGILLGTLFIAGANSTENNQANSQQQANGASYQSKTEKTRYIEYEEKNSIPNREQQVVSRRLSPYKQGTSLNSAVSIMPEDKIKVNFSFAHSGFSLDKENKDIPPDQLSFDWHGCVLVKAGRPAIAAATQDEEKAVFLIITADIQAD